MKQIISCIREIWQGNQVKKKIQMHKLTKTRTALKVPSVIYGTQFCLQGRVRITVPKPGKPSFSQPQQSGCGLLEKRGQDKELFFISLMGRS